MPRVELADVSVAYRTPKGGRVEAVKDVSFTIEDKPGVGEAVVFLGPSGCGKSTILKAVAGLLLPDTGTVRVRGAPVTGTGADRGRVFQAYTSFAWRTVAENVEFGLDQKGVPQAARRPQALRMLESVGLREFADAYPKALSGGMKQRVALARTLINEPAVLLMDEPFGALDPQTRWTMQSLILDVVRTRDNTVMFVTHDVAEAVYLADTMYVLSSRPARILERLDVPYFAERDARLRRSAELLRLEHELLDALHDDGVSGNIRVGALAGCGKSPAHGDILVIGYRHARFEEGSDDDA
jgi:NitT/TauT family transport system ATP-binding protein